MAWLWSIFFLGVLFVCASITLLAVITRDDGKGQDKGRQTRYLDRRRHYFRPVPRDEVLDGVRPTPKAVILALCRNSDLEKMLGTLKSFEDRFNRKYRYPYVFLNDEEFTGTFKKRISKLIKTKSDAKVQFGRVPAEHWGYPPWIDQERAATGRRKLATQGVPYAESESYRFMCRYYSGFFHKHPLLGPFDYYWRIEPGVEFLCDINYDVFRFMARTGKKYGFVIMMSEVAASIPTLWSTIMEEFVPKERAVSGGRLTSAINDLHSKEMRLFGGPYRYNGCHFWNNFEIASLSFFRSRVYQRYFEILDRQGGFFYERWGDAPVHSLAAGLMLSADEIHYFYDIGYRHDPFTHCPADFAFRRDAHCSCDPFDPTDISAGPCQLQWNLNFAA